MDLLLHYFDFQFRKHQQQPKHSHPTHHRSHEKSIACAAATIICIRSRMQSQCHCRDDREPLPERRAGGGGGDMCVYVWAVDGHACVGGWFAARACGGGGGWGRVVGGNVLSFHWRQIMAHTLARVRILSNFAICSSVARTETTDSSTGLPIGTSSASPWGSSLSCCTINQGSRLHLDPR